MARLLEQGACHAPRRIVLARWPPPIATARDGFLTLRPDPAASWSSRGQDENRNSKRWRGLQRFRPAHFRRVA